MKLRMVLALVLGVFAFTACGGDDGGGKKDSTDGQEVINPYQDVINGSDGTDTPDTTPTGDTAGTPDLGSNDSTGCTNLCTAGETQCVNANSFRTCGQGLSGCTVWGGPELCPGGTTCDTASGTCGGTGPVERKCTDQELQAFETCFSGCGETDATCQQGCLGQLSPVCEAAFMAFVQCAQGSGCGQDMACIEGKCAAEIEAVYGGGGTVTPSDCDPVTDQGCSAGQNCTIVSNPPNAALGCAPAGTAAIDEECGQTVGCADGVCLSADGVTYQCFQFCTQANNTCPAGRPCNVGFQGADWTFCGAPPTACDILAQDCPNNQGCFMIDQQGNTDCAPTQGKTAGQPCSYLNDCAPGHLCGGSGASGTCYQLCAIDGNGPTCTTGTCQDASLPVPNAGVCQ